MTIDKLGPIDPIANYNKTNQTAKAQQKEKSDSIDFSTKAKSMGELYKATESVKLSPDIREDRVAEVKKKMEDPNYINDKVVDTVADRILDLFSPS